MKTQNTRQPAPLGRLDQRLIQILAPLSVTVLAALFRLPGLGHPSTLVFDETYYVKDTHALLEHGWESVWPKDANDSYNQGITDVDENRPAFIVHPQLGKWLMALGHLAFGSDSPVGWRISTAVLGILMIPLIYVAAMLLFRSMTIATIAGFLLAVDGNAIVMSRTALLDGIVAFFALAGFVTILLDYHWHRRRLQRRFDTDSPRHLLLAFWRPWLFTSGIIFALAASVKWSGWYFLAIFGLYSVFSDLVLRKRLGQTSWFTASTLQAFINFLLLVPIALATYLANWWSWFLNGGYQRNWAEGRAWEGALSWVPLDVQSLWHYHVGMFNFHMGLDDATHPYSSPAWQWLPMIRPTLFYSVWPEEATTDNFFTRSGSVIHDIGNPLIWWLSTLAVVLLLIRMLRKPSWADSTILTGLAAAWLPWLIASDRIAYYFYTITLTPYLILAVTALLAWVMHHDAVPQGAGAGDFDTRQSRWLMPPWTELSGIRIVFWLLLAVFALSIFWLPLYIGAEIPQWFWALHIWLPSWG